MERINLIFFILGILLVVIGVIIKYGSSVLVGDILSLLGVIFSLSMLFRDQANKIIKILNSISQGQTKTTSLLEEQQKIHEEQLKILREINEKLPAKKLNKL